MNLIVFWWVPNFPVINNTTGKTSEVGHSKAFALSFHQIWPWPPLRVEFFNTKSRLKKTILKFSLTNYCICFHFWTDLLALPLLSQFPSIFRHLFLGMKKAGARKDIWDKAANFCNSPDMSCATFLGWVFALECRKQEWRQTIHWVFRLSRL